MLTTSLFSIFDPSLNLVSSLSWMSCFIVLLMIPSNMWMKSMNKHMKSSMMKFFEKEVKHSMSKTFKGGMMFIAAIFFTMALFNSTAMFPFIFSLTSHMSVNLPNSLMFWLTIMMMSWTHFMKNFLSHLIPSGTPSFLISFMVLVEILSNFIRPIALTFRLTANMMAGHLLLSLIGTAAISLPLSAMTVMALTQSLLVIMEMGVSIIQAYVFSTLLMLYMSE